MDRYKDQGNAFQYYNSSTRTTQSTSATTQTHTQTQFPKTNLQIMPQYMFLIKAGAGSEATDNIPDTPEVRAMNNKMFNKMTAFNEELVKEGALVDMGGFKPTKKGARVAYSGEGETTITPGPFDLNKERFPCGFWIIQAKNLDAALAYAKKVPFCESEITIHELGCAHGFPGFTEDLKEREQKIRDAIKDKKIDPLLVD